MAVDCWINLPVCVPALTRDHNLEGVPTIKVQSKLLASQLWLRASIDERTPN